MFTRRPRLSSRQPIDAAARPLPRLDTTPPVTKTYFADIAATSLFSCWDWPYLVGTIKYDRKSVAIEPLNGYRRAQSGLGSFEARAVKSESLGPFSHLTCW